MKSLLWFLVGVLGGLVAAHLLNKDPRGHELLAAVDARIGEFTDRIGDAYREQDARISGALSDARDAAAGAVATAKSTAADLADAAQDAAASAAGVVSDAAQDAAEKLSD